MKFIRDIIAEKRRAPAVAPEEDAEAHVTLNDAGKPGPATNDFRFDAVPLPESIEDADEPATADFRTETEFDAVEDDYQAAAADDHVEETAIDSFDLADEYGMDRRRQNLIDTLVKDASAEENDAGFIPDEPEDVKISDEHDEETDSIGESFSMDALHDSLTDEGEQAAIDPADETEDMLVDDAMEAEETKSFSAAEDEVAETEVMVEVSEEDTAPEADFVVGNLIKEEIMQAAEDTAPENMAAEPESEYAAPSAPVAEPMAEDTKSEDIAAEPVAEDIPVHGIAAAPVADEMPTPPEAEVPLVDLSVSIPRPTAGRTLGTSGRVKTRLLGFSSPGAAGGDPFAKKEEVREAPAYSSFPVGWLTVINGPGRGAAFTIFNGVSQIGRGEDQTVRLDFGDNSISRENHAAIAYDAEQRKFFLGHGGKANLVRLNNRPVLSTEELTSDAQIRIGETILRFVALCGNDFCWEQGEEDGIQNVARG